MSNIFKDDEDPQNQHLKTFSHCLTLVVLNIQGKGRERLKLFVFYLWSTMSYWWSYWTVGNNITSKPAGCKLEAYFIGERSSSNTRIYDIYFLQSSRSRRNVRYVLRKTKKQHATVWNIVDFPERITNYLGVSVAIGFSYHSIRHVLYIDFSHYCLDISLTYHKSLIQFSLLFDIVRWNSFRTQFCRVNRLTRWTAISSPYLRCYRVSSLFHFYRLRLLEGCQFWRLFCQWSSPLLYETKLRGIINM